MYLYCDRILIQILAFSLGPLVGLMITALTNGYLGIIGGVLGFMAIFLQPFFSDICLRDTADALKLGEVILGEGKVRYYSRGSSINQGKLFLCPEKIIFLVQNKQDIVLPLNNIDSVAIEQFNLNDLHNTKDIGMALGRKSPNLPQVVTMVSALTDVSSGLLRVKVKYSIFTNYFYFEVSTPQLWLAKIKELQENRI